MNMSVLISEFLSASKQAVHTAGSVGVQYVAALGSGVFTVSDHRHLTRKNKGNLQSCYTLCSESCVS